MSKKCDVHKKERETTGTESVPIPYRYKKKTKKKQYDIIQFTETLRV